MEVIKHKSYSWPLETPEGPEIKSELVLILIQAAPRGRSRGPHKPSIPEPLRRQPDPLRLASAAPLRGLVPPPLLRRGRRHRRGAALLRPERRWESPEELLDDAVDVCAKLCPGLADPAAEVEDGGGGGEELLVIGGGMVEVEIEGVLRGRGGPREVGRGDVGLDEAGEALGEAIRQILPMALHLLPWLEGEGSLRGHGRRGEEV